MIFLQNNCEHSMCLIFQVSSPFVEPYLKRATQYKPDNLEMLDLLWKYYEKTRNYPAAAKILCKLAERHRYARGFFIVFVMPSWGLSSRMCAIFLTVNFIFGNPLPTLHGNMTQSVMTSQYKPSKWLSIPLIYLCGLHLQGL